MLPKWLSGKESACHCRRHRRLDSIPGLGRSSGAGNGKSLQSSWLENSTNRRAWWAAVLRSLRVGHNWVTEHADSWSIFAIICHLWIFGNACLIPKASQVVLVVKNLPANAGDEREVNSIPGSGRSPGGGHGNPLQYSCLENPMGRGAWQATVHGVARSQTQLNQLSMHSHLIPITHTHTHTHSLRTL